jgi:hypothetical protein
LQLQYQNNGVESEFGQNEAICSEDTKTHGRPRQEELNACQRLIQGLQLNDREGLEIVEIEQVVQLVSQFSLDKLHSGGEIVQCTRLQVELAENVVLVETNGVHGLYRVLLSKSDQCPSPNVGEKAEAAVELAIDFGKTMCDIWEGLYTSEKIKAHCDNRKELKRHHGVKRLVCSAFGSCDFPEESTLYRAAFPRLVLLRVHKNNAMNVMMKIMCMLQEDVVRKIERSC